MSIKRNNNLRNTGRLALYASAATFALSIPTQAMAEETGSETLVLEEVIVTSTRRAVSTRNVPYNISAITGDLLDRLGVADVSDLGMIVPGLNVGDQGVRTAFISNGINIRGLSIEEVGQAFQPTQNVGAVAVYVNDTPLYSNLQLMDVSAVEINRGPQGTLYGSGALGGTLRYVMNKPDLSGPYAEVTSGLSTTKAASGLNHETKAIINLPLSENFAVRFNASYRKEQGFVDYNGLYAREGTDKFNPNAVPVLADPSDPVGSAAAITSVKDADDADALFLRASALYENDSFSATVNYFHQELNSDASASIHASSEDDDYTNVLKTLTPFESKVDLASLELEADLGFATLTSVTSYTKSKGQGLHDQTELYVRFPFYPGVYGDSPRPLIVDLTSIETKNTSQEIRLVSPGGQTIDWILGAYYQKSKNNASSQQFYPGYTDYSNACFGDFGFGSPQCGFGTLFGVFPNNGPFELNEANKDLAFASAFNDNFTDKAIFGEATWNISDVWQVTGGFRIFDQSYKVHQEGGLVFVPDGTVALDNEFTNSDQLFKVNTSYQFGDHMIYATWSEGFRRGGANALGIFSTPETATYIPDTVTNYEVGIKGLIDERIEYTLAFYHIDWHNMQALNTCSPLALPCTIDAGEASSQGIELEITAQLSENIRIMGGYNYIDAKLDEPSAIFGPNPGRGPALPGTQLPGSARHSGNLTMLYSTDLNTEWTLDANTSVSISGEKRSYIRTLDNTQLEAFVMVNTSVSISNDVLSLKLFVDNLFNETSRLSQEASHAGGYGPLGSAQARRPRTIGLSVQYKLF